MSDQARLVNCPCCQRLAGPVGAAWICGHCGCRWHEHERRASKPAVEWMPIESMPWDLERVLIVHDKRIKIGSRIAHNEGGTVWEIAGTTSHEMLMQQLGISEPTHWMPLPPPPTSSSGNGEKHE